MSKNTKTLITAADLEDVFNDFKSDKERIKYMKENYGDMDLAKSFEIFYGMKVSSAAKKSKTINTITTIVVGNVYEGTVASFNHRGITFEIPGVKEEILSKETFSDCFDEVQNYLMNHNGKLMFEVREKRNGKYYVSVINAYYRIWQQLIERCIASETPINVHIDDLVRGGYLCHTDIWPINELTGKNYTSSVFIPGSLIVLNIESDFNKWIGKDVDIIPQKFTHYRPAVAPAENSLVGSRKRLLQLEGFKNIHEIYTRMKLATMPGARYTPEVFEGTVTGIINSSKKTGAFVELDNKYITGLLPLNSESLYGFHPGDKIKVTVKEWECQPDKEPFVFDKKNTSQVYKCHLRPVFELA